MSNHPVKLPTRTAQEPTSSIWLDPSEDDFRQAVVGLEHLTNAVPLDSQTFSPTSWIETHPATPRQNRILSIGDEQRLSDDIAFISAVGEGAQSVTAATVQESRQRSPTLKVTLAAVDHGSQDFLRSIFTCLSQASHCTSSTTANDIFTLIGRHHRHRLLNRLRSSRWTKPQYLSRTHKKPLYADFPALIQRIPNTFGRAERRIRSELQSRLAKLAGILQDFENALDEDDTSNAEDSRRLALMTACYDICTSPVVAEYYTRLQAAPRPTSQIQGCLKTLQQVEKIASYRRIPMTLTHLAMEYPSLFQQVQLDFLGTPYEATPLDTAYRPWASATQVHAEVRLVVHHDTTDTDPGWATPRCLGASKYLCYLCYLFVRHHGAFFPSATHGACYDQWTVPDLDYSDGVCEHYRRTLKNVYSDILAATKDAVRRPEPMTSRENLLEGFVQDDPLGPSTRHERYDEDRRDGLGSGS